MPFCPHTEEDIRSMLATIGVASVEDLFDEIPAKLRARSLDGVPAQVSEIEISRIMHERAARRFMRSSWASAQTPMACM